MHAQELRDLLAPLKAKFRDDASAALITLVAEGKLDEAAVACNVDTGRALVQAGLHPATGGDGSFACSGDMLLQALVACAGVTLKAVATALEVPIRDGAVRAEGDLDFRGTLGISRDAPVGFADIRLQFNLETEASPEQVAKVIDLTERYCVVLQTLRHPPSISVTTQ